MCVELFAVVVFLVVCFALFMVVWFVFGVCCCLSCWSFVACGLVVFVCLCVVCCVDVWCVVVCVVLLCFWVVLLCL